ncbi:MAG: 3-phosphoshikimate 1-carboxyvinyltransferase [Pirellulales bacterium]|nr:3-phosphoshikimate 1-carboxyvinyltransferase [Pirellulales bacterium]
MNDTIEIRPSGPVRGAIRPPGSKSITNRALVCAALAEGVSTLAGVLDSEDTRVMVSALGQLGLEVSPDWKDASARVVGCAGRPTATEANLYVANSGTTVRFLTALVALGKGTFRLDGTPRMRERPIQPLLDALGQLGVRAESELGTGCPPVVVHARGISAAAARMSGTLSSQYLSGLLMAAGGSRARIDLLVEGELVSEPYVAMTLAVMRSFGVEVDRPEQGRFVVPASAAYRSCQYEIEPDASAASYFFAAAAITGGRVTVEGLSRHSLQGDVAFCDCLAKMGCRVEWNKNAITVSGGPLRGIDVDMNAISDTVQTLAAVALAAEGPSLIRNVSHIRHKETDRLAALATELRKLGAAVEEGRDWLRIVPGNLHGAAIDTYDDHRMAMSFAVAGLKVPGIVIRNPGCTAKTYPRFFEDLAQLTGDAADAPN